jgi:site-specific DNA-adenine methylase
LIWKHLGDPDNFCEPFCGSAAVLLLRPTAPKIETINDADHYVSNFWRATREEPQKVVEYCDGPVNETDLHARHRWLVLSNDAAEFRRKMHTDPDFYDCKVAGWWCWGLCQWIGGGWCVDPESAETAGGTGERRPAPSKENGIFQGEDIAQPGRGNAARTPYELNSRKTDANRPQLADAYDIGRGVHASPRVPDRAPMTGGGKGQLGMGIHATDGTCAQRRTWLLDWFARLRDRLRNVRVCCGDWKRVCWSPSVTTRLGLTGVLLDPPYGAKAERSAKIYAKDSLTVADAVRRYCLERGTNRLMRIALCGYEGEGHEELEKNGWRVVGWKTQGGYANRGKANKSKNSENFKRERIWFSPNCVFEKEGFI